MSATGADAEFIDWARRRVGSMIKDKYRVDSLLGVGGMACVYSATHRNGRRVALKMLHPELSIRGDLRTRFRREGQVANAVNHPGAVAVIDDDLDDDGTAFLVMELLEGQVVERLWEVNRRRLSAPVVLAIAREVCEVLVTAHRNGIVHRDIKPENLFLTNEGQLKILDFGLAHLSDLTKSKDTHTGMVFGTPAFMPPEQASGRVSQIDERTDIWSVGATMFTLLSGVIVHEGESAQHIVMLAAMEPARPLSDVLPDAHPALAALVDRALTHDKDMRWPNAAAMRDAILATSCTLFGEERTDLPRADEMTLVGVPALPAETPRPRTFDEDEQTRTDQNISTLGEDYPETENTQRRDRVTEAMDEAPPAPAGSGWSALRNVIESGGTGALEAPPVDVTRPLAPLEEMTQVNATKVLSTPNMLVAEERTSVMNIDLRGSSPRISASYPSVIVQGSHPSGPPAPPSLKPRPPSLSPNMRASAQTVTMRIAEPRRISVLPWALTATAIAIALVAVGFAVMTRTPKKPVPDLFASTPLPTASVVPRTSPPAVVVVDAGTAEPQ